MSKAIRFNQLGGLEVLQIEDLPQRQPGPREVLLEVEAVGPVQSITGGKGARVYQLTLDVEAQGWLFHRSGLDKRRHLRSRQS
jgi:hypothetical protein